MKTILLTIGLIISTSMMGNTTDTVIVYQNEDLIRAGRIGQKQLMLQFGGFLLVKRFSDLKHYNEAIVFTAVIVVVNSVLEYKKWELIENAGKHFVSSKS